ncbi:mitogen-activated protein kinase kinase kinase [Talaromyces islandicus]|uniref:Mitogen-activated protein kinase kinae kinase bck1 n=1 Tax=Talaromyces islandicus TaxID=28573 RepID=A0A0U1LS10_TALIS|nr:mitogen-activated protein kinase kinase kinase [Talaromyces islandicus]
MDQRQQYIPPPPPPLSQNNQAHMIPLPPPPPRPSTQQQQQQHGLFPPPPPGPPPSAYPGSNQRPIWPPPPPTIHPSLIPASQPYGRQQPTPLSIPIQPIPPPPSEVPPLTSATYIPAGESFGPGVGIPPLYDNYGQSATVQPANQPWESAPVDKLSRRDGNIPSTPSARNLPPSLTLGNDNSETMSPGFSAYQNYGNEPARTSSHNHNASNTSLGRTSTGEAIMNWPLERVVNWLARNGFSKDWQETFKFLELEGADFLGLGLRANGRGNLGKLHQQIYPQLAKECQKSGTGWDQAREQKEGTRLRKLIREIQDDGNEASSQTNRRRESQTMITSASTEGGLENSPNLGWEPTFPSSGPVAIMEPSYTQHPAHRQTPNSGGKQNNQTRPGTAPFPHRQDAFDGDSLYTRSEYSRSALASLEDFRKQSPSSPSDGGPFKPPSSKAYEGSPQSTSPAMPSTAPLYSAPASSSTGDLHARFEHHRGNSADSTGHGSSTVRRFYKDQKQVPDNILPATQDSKDSQKSLFLGGFFKRKHRSHDSSHPSPEDQSLDSPTSPSYIRHSALNSPFIKSSNNNSDASLGDRPPSSSFSDYEKMHRPNSVTRHKKYVFATLDGWNYRLVDITDVETADHIRAAICQNLGIVDWSSAQIFVTEPGQVDHDELLDDSVLVHSRRVRSDSLGSLKLYVRDNISPSSAGLGVSFLDKSLSPLSGHVLPSNVQANPPLGSRQSTLKASSGQPSPSMQVSSTSDVGPDAEPTARKEEYKREFGRKQQEYFKRKQPPPLQLRKGSRDEIGIRNDKVIDFDQPRISPYEDKKHDGPIPQRKPPSAPSESSTLTKVNSLTKSRAPGRGRASSKEQHEIAKYELIQEERPIGSSDVHSMNFSGTRKPSMAASSRPPSSASQTTFTNSASSNPRRPSSSVSSLAQPPSLQSRKSFGPEYDFEETKVDFATPHTPQSSSDDDSDDGLFQKPLSTSKPKASGKGLASPGTSPKARKPSLSVNTSSTRSNKGRSVTFISPGANDEEPIGPPYPSSAVFSSEPRSGFDANGATFPSTGHSPEEERPIRRNSSFATDVWASRPPVEGVINNLDDFFPNIDLDEPYLEPSGISPPVSPINAMTKGQSGPSYQQQSPSAIASGYDIPAPYEPPSKNSIAKRNIEKASGLSRMKSIREVAQGAQQQVKRNKTVVNQSNKKSGEILRRKSTKMFGAKIMQISPKPGSRLSQLEPIPQNGLPPEPVPKRQQTFRIIRGQLIGKGTYGRVYLGMNADTGDVLAVKQVEVNPRIAGQDKDRIKEMVAAMDQEIDTMQHLEHPNIVQYLGCERGELSISIYLEYISGGSIGSCLRKHGKFEESVVKSLTQQTLSGLAYLHDQGILHRDLKADNILLDLDGTGKISDFGISKKTDNIYGNDASNSMQGSVFWMAPEVVQSQGQGYSAKVDIWSLGCVVLEMFAGRRPWSREEAIGAIFKLGSLSQAPPIPEEVAVNISPAALAFMYDCFTIDTFDRPTAEILLSHPFCVADPTYNFESTELYAKISDVL